MARAATTVKYARDKVFSMKTTERIVYESKAQPKRGEVVRYTMHGIKHRQVSIGGKYRTQIKLGSKWATVLNQELPAKDGQYIAHPQDGVCGECNHIYTHLMRNAGQPCDECRLQNMAELGQRIQDEYAVDLGWHTTDHDGDRERWGYKDQAINRSIRTACLRR